VVGWGQPLLPEILGQLAPVGAKSILKQCSLVAPQPTTLERNRRFSIYFRSWRKKFN